MLVVRRAYGGMGALPAARVQGNAVDGLQRAHTAGQLRSRSQARSIASIDATPGHAGSFD
ncbi:hypothetical protein XarbCFBP6827_17760 [Xanthomonas arboricola]|nr:hypothetical protein XarbCFBP6827_17760 [Xanthomonas arboricola]